MDMNEMLQITRLVQSGDLRQATAKIQRAWRGTSTSDSAAVNVDLKREAPVIEGVFRVIEDDAPTTDAPYETVKESTARQARPDNPFAQFHMPPATDWREQLEKAFKPTPAPDSKPEVEPGGRFVSGAYANQAGTRDYKLYIPSAYHGQKLPLVVMLHGCTQNPDDFAAGSRMNVLAEERQCFVVYPAQAPNANGQRCWNWFKAVDQQRDKGEPSLIAGITRQIMNDYAVDAQQVYVAGFSAGGAMAAVMGMTYPDLYAAAGVHSGLPYAIAHDLPSALAAMHGGTIAGQPQSVSGREMGARNGVIPTIVFHGDRDATVHPRNGDQVIAQCATMHVRNEQGADAGKKPRVTVQQGQAPGGHAYSRATYRDGKGKSILEHWRIHGAGHAWSGGSPRGSYTDPRGPDAAREMIRFFYENPHSQA